MNPSRDKKRTFRAMGFRLFAILFGLTLALIAGELVLRFFDLAPSIGVVTVDAQEFVSVPGLLKPNQNLVDRKRPALPHKVRVNALGYRGEDFTAAKPDGEIRILMVGDSFTYGDNIDNDGTLPAQFETQLKGRCASRVINAGVAGTTIVTHVEMTKRAYSISPDLVVLIFSENDIADVGRTPLWNAIERNRELKSKPPLSLIFPVLRRTALWNFSKSTYHVLVTNLRAMNATETGQQRQRELTVLYREKYKKLLIGLRNELLEHEIPMVFAIFPNHESVARPDLPENLAWIIETARGLDLPVVSFLESLRDSALSLEALYLVPHDGHASPEGYRIAAATLLRELDWQALGLNECAEK